MSFLQKNPDTNCEIPKLHPMCQWLFRFLFTWFVDWKLCLNCSIVRYFGMMFGIVNNFLLCLFCRYKLFILVFTFFAYTSFHLSRKPISVVKVCLQCLVVKHTSDSFCHKINIRNIYSDKFTAKMYFKFLTNHKFKHNFTVVWLWIPNLDTVYRC